MHGTFEHGTAISKLVLAETVSNVAIEMSHRLAVFHLRVPVVVTTNTVNTIISAAHRSVSIFSQNVGAHIFKTLWENRGWGLGTARAMICSSANLICNVRNVQLFLLRLNW